MIQKKKVLLINELKTIFNVSKFVYIVDIEGLNANTMSLFRGICFQHNVKVQLIKNTLIKKAINQINNPKLFELYPYLKGNTVVLISDIENLPAKLIQNFRKNFSKPILKAAWIHESIFFGDKSLNVLATLKSKEELIGDLIGNIILSPIKNVLFSLRTAEYLILDLLQILSKR